MAGRQGGSGPRRGSGEGTGRGGNTRGGSGRGSASGAGRGGSARGTGRGSTRGAGQARGPARAQRGGRPDDRQAARTEEQQRYDGPPIPDGITGGELDRSSAQQLTGLPEKLAARVAAHLVAAGQLIGTDPETAHRHALAARARAARVALVREAVGETAYAAGLYAEALSELRAARRMNGAVDYLPVIADCERAVGKPARAIDLARSEAAERLSRAGRVEMRIVEAGARADLGQLDQALKTLEAGPAAHRQPRGVGGADPLRLRRPARPGGAPGGCAGVVPPHCCHRWRRTHRRRRTGERARGLSQRGDFA